MNRRKGRKENSRFLNSCMEKPGEPGVVARLQKNRTTRRRPDARRDSIQRRGRKREELGFVSPRRQGQKAAGEGDNVVVVAKGVYAWQNGKPGGDGRKSGDKVDRWRFFTHLVRRASICIKPIASFFPPSLSLSASTGERKRGRLRDKRRKGKERMEYPGVGILGKLGALEFFSGCPSFWYPIAFFRRRFFLYPFAGVNISESRNGSLFLFFPRKLNLTFRLDIAEWESRNCAQINQKTSTFI